MPARVAGVLAGCRSAREELLKLKRGVSLVLLSETSDVLWGRKDRDEWLLGLVESDVEGVRELILPLVALYNGLALRLLPNAPMIEHLWGHTASPNSSDSLAVHSAPSHSPARCCVAGG